MLLQDLSAVFNAKFDSCTEIKTQLRISYSYLFHEENNLQLTEDTGDYDFTTSSHPPYNELNELN